MVSLRGPYFSGRTEKYGEKVRQGGPRRGGPPCIPLRVQREKRRNSNTLPHRRPRTRFAGAAAEVDVDNFSPPRTQSRPGNVQITAAPSSRIAHRRTSAPLTRLRRGDCQGGHIGVSPLDVLFLLPLLSARAERNGAPAGRQARLCNKAQTVRRGHGVKQKETAYGKAVPPQGALAAAAAKPSPSGGQGGQKRKNRLAGWVRQSGVISRNYSIALSLRAILDFLFAALFLWIRFFPAALSTALTATL